MHSDDKLDGSTAEQKKLEIITFYNSTKDSVDCVDERTAFYSVARYTRRRTTVIFHVLCYIAVLNSFFLYLDKITKILRNEKKNLCLL